MPHGGPVCSIADMSTIRLASMVLTQQPDRSLILVHERMAAPMQVSTAQLERWLMRLVRASLEPSPPVEPDNVLSAGSDLMARSIPVGGET